MNKNGKKLGKGKRKKREERVSVWWDQSILSYKGTSGLLPYLF
jgi:hypothetical protein